MTIQKKSAKKERFMNAQNSNQPYQLRHLQIREILSFSKQEQLLYLQYHLTFKTLSLFLSLFRTKTLIAISSSFHPLQHKNIRIPILITPMVFIPSEFIPEYRPARKFSPFSSHGWWLNRWPLLGWLETFVKIAAWCFIPYVSVENAPLAQFETISHSFVIETCVMLVAAVLLTVAIIDRLVYREILSMIFVFPNNWAHWTVAMAMWRGGRNGIHVRYMRVFCWLMFAGDIVKLIFFAVHDFSRLNISRYVS